MVAAEVSMTEDITTIPSRTSLYSNYPTLTETQSYLQVSLS